MHPIEAHAVARAIHHERLAEAERARQMRRQREAQPASPRGRRKRRTSRLRLRLVAAPARGWRAA
ncbi:hypothetical protein UQW22_17505 [Isoptericola halotolerans]|uniref:hypothetical protein n=1 Tax=Isoptericola halotolerans TaxID=300560 RepID=UPI00388FC03A